jgi:hypothetical protein
MTTNSIIESISETDNFNHYSIEIRDSILKYLKQLDDKQLTAYFIAKEHLGTSFDIVKSIGYIEWKKNQHDS